MATRWRFALLGGHGSPWPLTMFAPSVILPLYLHPYSCTPPQSPKPLLECRECCWQPFGGRAAGRPLYGFRLVGVGTLALIPIMGSQAKKQL